MLHLLDLVQIDFSGLWYLFHRLFFFGHLLLSVVVIRILIHVWVLILIALTPSVHVFHECIEKCILEKALKHGHHEFFIDGGGWVLAVLNLWRKLLLVWRGILRRVILVLRWVVGCGLVWIVWGLIVALIPMHGLWFVMLLIMVAWVILVAILLELNSFVGLMVFSLETVVTVFSLAIAFLGSFVLFRTPTIPLRFVYFDSHRLLLVFLGILFWGWLYAEEDYIFFMVLRFDTMNFTNTCMGFGWINFFDAF